MIKQGGALALAAVNLTLLAWSMGTWRQKRSMTEGYFWLLRFSPGIAALQLGVGLFFLAEGRHLDGMHLLYGMLVGTGALAQVMIGRRTRLGQTYRGRPLVHGFLALFVTLLTLRSWMSS